MRPLTVACCLTLLVTATAFTAARKGILFWNLAGEPLTDVSPAPAGTRPFRAVDQGFLGPLEGFQQEGASQRVEVAVGLRPRKSNCGLDGEREVAKAASGSNGQGSTLAPAAWST